MFFFDQKVTCFFSNNEFRLLDEIASTLTDLGKADIYFVLSLLGVLVFSLAVKKDNQNIRKWAKYKSLSLLSFYAFLFSGIIIMICKFLFGRQRPYFSEMCDPWVFTWFNFHWNFQSMPSGHTQVVFTAWALSHFLNWKWSWLVLVYAILLASTRVIIYRHFPSDVFISIGITYICVWWVTKKNMKKNKTLL